MTKTYAPPAHWISPPGESIEDAIEELGWSKVELAQRLGVTPKHVNELLRGRASITPEMAVTLSQVLGSTARFWLNRETGYRADLARKESLEGLEKEVDWLSSQPLRWMIGQGMTEKKATKGEQVEALLSAYGVASVSAWRQVYGSQVTAFRASPSFSKKEGSVIAWLRKAEIDATLLSSSAWDERRFALLLPTLRRLTLVDDPSQFLPRLREECASCGVCVVWVPTPLGCPVSGATRWLTPRKAMLVLSLRHKTNDHLWFTFFHEAGHLLLHGKKLLFLEGNGMDGEEEEQANHFARDLLIPPRYGRRLAALRGTHAQVVEFAEEVGIAPGLVVGRLQHDKLLPPSHLNALKVSYEWNLSPQSPTDPIEGEV